MRSWLFAIIRIFMQSSFTTNVVNVVFQQQFEIVKKGNEQMLIELFTLFNNSLVFGIGEYSPTITSAIIVKYITFIHKS
jgi:hypothetical protein